jgi:hypothetical protein
MSDTIEMIIPARRRDIGGFEVGRVLPTAKRRLVGPFIFFDHMGPTQSPAWQASSAWQAFPHSPQCSASLERSRHCPSHRGNFPGHCSVHVPSAHTFPSAHCIPQPPQCAGSNRESMQIDVGGSEK